MELQKLLKKKKKAIEDDNKTQLALACKNLGDYHIQEANYKNAVKEYKQEADIHHQEKNQLKYAIANRWIGEAFMGLDKFDESLKHVETYLKISLELDDKIETERAYTSLGRVYLSIGQLEEGQNQPSLSVSPQKALKQAEKCFIKGVLKCKDLAGLVSKNELTDMKARLYLNLSLTKEITGEMDKALEYMTKAIALCKDGELFEILHKCYMAISNQYVKLRDNENALRYINLASDVAERLSHRVTKCCETLIAYASILIKSGDYQSAKQVLMKAYKLKTPLEADRQSVESSLRTVAALCKAEDDLIVVYAGDYKRRRELYEKMGDGSCALGNYDKAAIYYEHTLENARLNKENGSTLIPIYVSLYETYRDMKSYKKALKYMWEEFELCKDNAKESAYTLLSIAETTTLSGDDASVAEGILKQALKSVKAIEDRDVQVKVLLKMLEFCSKSGHLQMMFEGELQAIGITLVSLEEHGKQLREQDDATEEDKEDTPNIGDEISLDNLSGSDSELDVDEEVTKRSSLRTRTAMNNKIRRNAKGETELHTACIAGNVSSVQRLLNSGHPVNVRDHAGWLPLHEAANHGYIEVVSLLLEGGSKGLINDRGDSSCEGITPLHDACSNGHLKIVELLLDRGANPTIRTDAGETPSDFLAIWRKSVDDLSPVEESFYETLRVRLADAEKKVCPVGVMPQQSRRSAIQSKSLRRQSSDKENRTKIGNLRLGIVDDEDDSSNDSINDRKRSSSTAAMKRKTDATDMYKSAISNLRSKGGVSDKLIEPDEIEEQRKRPAYLDSQELELDDWLEEDLVRQEKKKRRYMADETKPRKTSSLSLTRRDPKKIYNNMSDLVQGGVVESSNDPYLGLPEPDAFDVIMNAKQVQRKTKNNSAKRRPSQGSTASINQSSLIQAGFSKNVFDDDDDLNGVNDSGITSPVKSSRSSTLNVSNGATSGFITMKVKIEDQLIVVPVKAGEAGSYTMKWLAENAAKRYENIHGRLPFLSLCTTDGAVFDENDPLEIVTDMKPYISTAVKRWTQKTLSDSYVTCCAITKQDVNSSILSRLQSHDSQNVIDLSKLNLTAADMAPFLKSIQCNSNILRFDLSYNLIDDQGVINVCQAVTSLARLKSLNLSGNLLTIDGVMKMENQFSVSRISMAELSELSLSFNKITDGGVKNLSRMSSALPNLSNLHLKSCKLTTLDHYNVAFDQLVCLNLSHNSFKNLTSLWANLRPDKIRELNFDLAISSSYSTFPNELIDFFKCETHCQVRLERLSLASCNFSDSLVWQLVQELKRSNSLKYLSLMNNTNLSALTVKTLIDSNLPLEVLNLCGCHQIAADLKVSELQECNSNLPRKLILTISNVEDKDSFAEAFKNLWVAQFGMDQVRVWQKAQTLMVSCNTE